MHTSLIIANRANAQIVEISGSFLWNLTLISTSNILNKQKGFFYISIIFQRKQNTVFFKKNFFFVKTEALDDLSMKLQKLFTFQSTKPCIN